MNANSAKVGTAPGQLIFKQCEFQMRDSISGAHTFREIFLLDHYPHRLLKRARCVVDVGANIGLFGLYARLASPQARILCFEADPSTYEVLRQNIAKLPVDQSALIESFHCAAGSEYGSAEFYCCEVSGWSSLYNALGAGSSPSATVDVVPLSQFLVSQNVSAVDFLKIDVEGAEYEILLGDQKLFDLPISVLAVEIDRHPTRRNPKCKWTFEDIVSAIRGRFSKVKLIKPEADYPVVVAYNNRGNNY